jgi:hypothetical protein
MLAGQSSLAQLVRKSVEKLASQDFNSLHAVSTINPLPRLEMSNPIIVNALKDQGSFPVNQSFTSNT